MEQCKAFYDREYSHDRYCIATQAKEHPRWAEVERFVRQYGLHGSRCLEVGCGRGAFQDVVEDYTGVDIADSVRPYLHKTFHQASATELPFRDNSFDAVWTLAVLEHVSQPEEALIEMRRVLRPDGLLLLSPAWQCRTWAADGYPVRPYSDFPLRGKLIKASVPLRNTVVVRAVSVMPRRLIRLLTWALQKRPSHFQHGVLTPNYDRFWMSDSDALNAMDPYEAILWFVSRGDQCLSHPTWLRQFLIRTGGLVVRIRKA